MGKKYDGKKCCNLDKINKLNKDLKRLEDEIIILSNKEK